MGDPRQHVHELIDRLPPVQLSALAGLLEAIVEHDPVAEALRNAPLDDEPESEEEKQAVQEARDWLAQNGGKGIPHEEAMRRLGLTRETDWTEPALEDMAALDKAMARRVKQAVERLAAAGAGNVKRLQGIDPPEFRLRVGDYRVRFHQDSETVRVLRVRNRREAYR